LSKASGATPQSAPLESVHTVTAHGMRWQGLATAVGQATQALVTLTGAALMSPSEFALWGIAAIIFNAQHLFGNFGFGPALIYRDYRQREQDAVDSAFLATGALALLVGAGAFALAPLLASLFTEGFAQAQVIDVIRTMTLALVLMTAASIPQALIEKSLRFRRRALPEIACALLYVGLGLGLLAAGYGIWALVVATAVRTGVLLLLFWIFAPVHPRRLPRLKWALVRDMFQYGKFLTGTAVLGFVFTNLDTLSVGWLAGASALGAYALAYPVVMLVPTFLSQTLGRVFFPLFASVRSDPTRLREVFMSATHYLALLMIPTTLVMMLLLPSVLVDVLGKEWGPARPLLQVLALYGLLRAVGLLLATFLSGTGRPHRLPVAAAMEVGVVAALVLPLSAFGVVGIAWAFTLAEVVAAGYMGIAGYTAMKGSRILGRELVNNITGPVVSSMAALLVGLGLGMVASVGGWLPLVGFVLAYVAAVAMVDPVARGHLGLITRIRPPAHPAAAGRV
jgi:O-antigen/teichoic acid export membrane protein